MYVDITDVPHNYYEFEEVDQCMDINNSLIIFHHIIRSIGCNFNQLVVEMEQNKTKIVIIVLTETWFDGLICDDIDGYVHIMCVYKGKAVPLCIFGRYCNLLLCMTSHLSMMQSKYVL